MQEGARSCVFVFPVVRARCSNFFPIVLSIFRNLPIIGPCLNLPFVQRILDRMMGATLPTHMASA